MSDQGALIGFRVVLEGKESKTLWHIGWGEDYGNTRLPFVLERVFYDFSASVIQDSPPADKELSMVLRLAAHNLSDWPGCDEKAPGHAVWRSYENCLPRIASGVSGFGCITLTHSQVCMASELEIVLRLNAFSSRERALTLSACGLFGLTSFTMGYLLCAGAEAR